MRSLSSLLISLAVALAGAAHAAPPAAQPTVRVEIEYEVLRNGRTMAEVHERLEHGNGAYRVTETWKGKGLYALLGKATRTSEGSFGPEGPRPREYMDERSGRDTQRVWFDWGANTITRRYKGPARTEPLLPGTQDRLSFLLALGFLWQKGQPINLYIADGRGLAQHVYKPNGRERLTIPAGKFDTVKLIRHKEGSGEVSEIWIAVDRGNLPVRIVLLEPDGTRYEHLAIRISQ